jgi:hypothetical protein
LKNELKTSLDTSREVNPTLNEIKAKKNKEEDKKET